MSPEPGPGTRSGGTIAAPGDMAVPPGAAPTVGRAAVAALLDGLGLGARQLDFVAKASTSEVWRADTAEGPVAVRFLVPRPGKPADFAADVALRRELAAHGARVAVPLADSGCRPDLAVVAHAPAWAIDRWIEGEPAGPGTAAAIWRDLGALLAELHTLPVRGHGRLQVAHGRLEGRLDDPVAAVADRFDQPWPFDGSRLVETPLAEAAPDLVPRLQRLEDSIRSAADAAPVIVHGDLNGANVRHADGRLRGLLDVADAAVLAPAWDFALLQHFHGGAVVARSLAGYTADGEAAAALSGDARLLGLVVALHHLSRAKTIGLPARRTYSVGRLRRGLDAIEAS